MLSPGVTYNKVGFAIVLAMSPENDRVPRSPVVLAIDRRGRRVITFPRDGDDDNNDKNDEYDVIRKVAVSFLLAGGNGGKSQDEETRIEV